MAPAQRAPSGIRHGVEVRDKQLAGELATTQAQKSGGGAEGGTEEVHPIHPCLARALTDS